MNNLLDQLREELLQKCDEKNRISGMRYFREEVKLFGIKASEIKQIAHNYYSKIPHTGKTKIFDLCEELWKSGFFEESIIACEWSYNVRKHYEPSDFHVFEKWVSHYVSNWASCDTLCNHTIGEFIEKFPEFISGLKNWTLSENRWMRRGSAVSLIIPARKGKFQEEIFEIATLLLTDRDDMVQKGYGWMLKAASQAHQDKVYAFVMKNKYSMPRTALRYAIEKMPGEMRQSAMAL